MSSFGLNWWSSTLTRWWNYFNPDTVQFDAEALEHREKYRPDYRIVANSLSTHLDFQTVLDVGCAQGFLMEPLHEKGFDVRGIEISEDVLDFLSDELKSRVRVGDFSKANGSYDLVCCIEVAEHIEPVRSEELVDKLSDLAEAWIYFTAAPPGQPGHGHINCRPHQHWIQWFEQRGWQMSDTVTGKLRQDLNAVEYTHWLRDNSFIFSAQ